METTTPGELFYPDLSLRPAFPAQTGISDDPKHLRALRGRFERGLLKWFRNGNDPAGPLEMREAVAGIESQQTVPAARAFWFAATAFFDALGQLAIPVDAATKRLCGRIDAQMRLVMEGSSIVAERLMRDVLYHVATASAHSPIIDTVRSTYELAKETLLTIFTLGFYLYTFNFNPQTEYIAEPKKNTKETAFSSILFAIVVATFVHTYFIQPFTIPSSSLEKSLLIGDFLFVSKVDYGPRVPMTTGAAPMVHDTLPFIKTKSYLYRDNDTTSWKNKLQLPYMRIPGFEKIKNNDIVVFNWPRDTLYHMYLEADRRYDKPIDKKTNYVNVV